MIDDDCGAIGGRRIGRESSSIPGYYPRIFLEGLRKLLEDSVSIFEV
jgi:hypothetical protein